MLDVQVSRIMQKQKLLTATPGTCVARAAQRMSRRNVGAMLVVEADRLLGIVTERDIVFRVVAAGRDATATPISAVMTPDPRTIEADKPFGYALVLMRRGGFRHLPVVRDGRPVGIVSARSALDPDLEEFTAEIQRRRRYDSMP